MSWPFFDYIITHVPVPQHWREWATWHVRRPPTNALMQININLSPSVPGNKSSVIKRKTQAHQLLPQPHNAYGWSCCCIVTRVVQQHHYLQFERLWGHNLPEAAAAVEVHKPQSDVIVKDLRRVVWRQCSSHSHNINWSDRMTHL